MDNTTIHPKSGNRAHLVDLHLWRGAPQNLDDSREIQILVNQGYVVGFCPDRLQPAWSAYRVAHAESDVKYDRPINYYNDLRLDEEYRIGKKTFGKIGGIQLNVGHMTPNEVINRQFGRLAQMETFFMSNMSPQYQSLNQGVWLKLEDAIRNIKDEKGKDHVWVIVGPIFGEEPEMVYRGKGKHLPIPESYFCITVDPYKYPFDTLSKAHIDCFIIPQNAPSSSNPEDYPSTLEEIEEATNLRFFDSWSRDIPLGQQAYEESYSDSRLMNLLKRNSAKAQQSESLLERSKKEASSINELIDLLKSEAARIKGLDRILTVNESSQLKSIQHTVSWLIKARTLSCDVDESTQVDQATKIITYKIVSDLDGKLKEGARIACNFWNRFIEPKNPIVIRLETFTRLGNTIAVAHYPSHNNGTTYGRVRFNTRYLGNYNSEKIAGTIIHEIGHVLGIGWDDWNELYNKNNGKFTSDAIAQLDALKSMEVERDGGRGTAYAHWDERIFDKELMTGIKDDGEYVLPVTIDLMEVLGHRVVEKLEYKTDLNQLMLESSKMLFSLQEEVKNIDLDYFEKTCEMETIPHGGYLNGSEEHPKNVKS
ncbi:MAG: DNA/RNA non-specific endonuclease [Flavobacteriales bacterium]|nr:DNA/RNA non-specific endonuclease [Flavobacteriales bacterium]